MSACVAFPKGNDWPLYRFIKRTHKPYAICCSVSGQRRLLRTDYSVLYVVRNPYYLRGIERRKMSWGPSPTTPQTARATPGTRKNWAQAPSPYTNPNRSSVTRETTKRSGAPPPDREFYLLTKQNGLPTVCRPGFERVSPGTRRLIGLPAAGADFLIIILPAPAIYLGRHCTSRENQGRRPYDRSCTR